MWGVRRKEGREERESEETRWRFAVKLGSKERAKASRLIFFFFLLWVMIEADLGVDMRAMMICSEGKSEGV